MPLAFVAADCSMCLRTPQQRGAWLIDKWRGEGRFVEPPQAPCEKAVTEERKRWRGKSQQFQNGTALAHSLPTIDASCDDIAALIAPFLTDEQ